MLYFIKNHYSSKILSLVMAFALISITTKAEASIDNNVDPIVLKSGTVIPLVTTQEINSDFISNGEVINFLVERDVEVDGKVVISRGAMAKGQVTQLQERKAIGKEGTMTIKIKSVTAIDGQEIFLSGSTINESGEDQKILSIVLGVLVCLLLLLIKGKPAVIQNGSSFEAYTSSTVTIEA